MFCILAVCIVCPDEDYSIIVETLADEILWLGLEKLINQLLASLVESIASLKITE